MNRWYNNRQNYTILIQSPFSASQYFRKVKTCNHDKNTLQFKFRITRENNTINIFPYKKQQIDLTVSTNA